LIFPIGDTPNPPGRPVVNYALIGVNVAVFLLVTLPLASSAPNPNDPALYEYIRSLPGRGYSLRAILGSLSAYDLFLFKYAYRPAEASFTALFTSMFLHAGWAHLFGNMLFLWIYGDNVEMRMGSGRYLLAYLATGVAATLFYSIFAGDSNLPMIGASGAISGVLGFYFLWFPKNKVKLMFFLFPFFMDVILVPARIVLGIYLVIENFLPMLLGSSSGGGVAYGAHIGGFLGGLALAWTLDRFPDLLDRSHWEDERGEEEPAAAGPRPDRVRPVAELVREAVALDEMELAAGYYFTLGTPRERAALRPDDIMRIGDHLLGTRRYDPALTLFRRYIAEHPRGPYLDWAFLGAGMALLHGRRQTAAAYQYFLQVLDADPSPKAEEEARRMIAMIEAMDRHRRRRG